MAKETGRIAALIFCLFCFLGRMTVYGDQRNESSQVNEASGGATTWCIAKPSTSQSQLDNIINFCCTGGGVDCSLIQPGGNCYLLNKNSDASVVMNIYYNTRGKITENCYFDGYGLTVATDPSVGNCIYKA